MAVPHGAIVIEVSVIMLAFAFTTFILFFEIWHGIFEFAILHNTHNTCNAQHAQGTLHNAQRTTRNTANTYASCSARSSFMFNQKAYLAITTQQQLQVLLLNPVHHRQDQLLREHHAIPENREATQAIQHLLLKSLALQKKLSQFNSKQLTLYFQIIVKKNKNFE